MTHVHTRETRHTSKNTCPQTRYHDPWLIRGNPRGKGGGPLASARAWRFRNLGKNDLRLGQGSERPPLRIRDTLRLQTAPSVHARPRVGSTAETIACQLPTSNLFRPCSLW